MYAYMYIYICICTHISLSIYVYIYIYIYNVYVYTSDHSACAGSAGRGGAESAGVQVYNNKNNRICCISN